MIWCLCRFVFLITLLNGILVFDLPQIYAAEQGRGEAASDSTQPKAEKTGSGQAATDGSPQSAPPSAKKAYEIGINVQYLNGFKPIDPSAGFAVSGGYSWDEQNHFGASVSLGKSFYVNPGEDSVRLNDIILSQSHKFPEKIFDAIYQQNFSVSLPVSQYSRDNGIITHLRGGVGFDRPLIQDLLSVQLSPSVDYYWNEYKTTRSNSGTPGIPLEHYAVGLSLGLSGTIMEKWSVSLGTSYAEVRYEKSHRQAAIDLPDHPYSFDLGSSYQVMDNLSFSAGISHGTIVEDYGKFEYLYFDRYVDVWSISVDYGLPL